MNEWQRAAKAYLAERKMKKAAEALVNYGTSSYRASYHTEATEAFERASRIATEIGDQRLQAQAEIGLGNIDRFHGRVQSGIEHYEIARNIFNNLNDSAAEADAIRRIGYANSIVSLPGGCAETYATVKKYYDAAASLIERGGGKTKEERRMVAEQTHAQAELDFRFGNYDQARVGYAKARERFKAIGEPANEGHALRGLGNVALHEDLYDSAADYYRDAKEKLAQGHDGIGPYHVAYNLAEMALRRGDLNGAFKLFFEAKTGYQGQESQRSRARALRGLGDVELRQKQWREAQKYFNEALNDLSFAPDVLTEAAVYRGIGDIAMIEHRIDAAKSAYNQSYEAASRACWQAGQAEARVGLAYVEMEESRNPQAAIDRLKEAQILMDRDGNRLGGASVKLRLGRLEKELGDPQADQHIEQARATFQTIGHTKFLGEVEALSTGGDRFVWFHGVLSYLGNNVWGILGGIAVIPPMAEFARRRRRNRKK